MARCGVLTDTCATAHPLGAPAHVHAVAGDSRGRGGGTCAPGRGCSPGPPSAHAVVQRPNAVGGAGVCQREARQRRVQHRLPRHRRLRPRRHPVTERLSQRTRVQGPAPPESEPEGHRSSAAGSGAAGTPVGRSVRGGQTIEQTPTQELE